MATMREMAAEYRLASAKMAMKLREKRAAGASGFEIRALEQALVDIRAVQRTLEGYYDLPRDPSVTSAGWYGRGRSKDDG